MYEKFKVCNSDTIHFICNNEILNSTCPLSKCMSSTMILHGHCLAPYKAQQFIHYNKVRILHKLGYSYVHAYRRHKILTGENIDQFDEYLQNFTFEKFLSITVCM